MWNPDSETLSPAQRAAREENALARQFAYVMAHSAFYQHKLRGASGISTRAELTALPFTEKDELRASQEAHPPFGDYLAAPPETLARVHKTSGTTGRPLYIALTARDIETTHECGARAYVCAGLGRGDRVIHCLNYQLWAGGVTDHLSLERTGATVIPFGVGNTHVLLRTIRDLQVNAISSTPSYLVHLADIVRAELGVEPHELGLRKGFFGGEPGLQNPNVRGAMERTWNLRAMDANYGMADVLSIFGAECARRDRARTGGKNQNPRAARGRHAKTFVGRRRGRVARRGAADGSGRDSHDLRFTRWTRGEECVYREKDAQVQRSVRGGEME